MELNYTGEVINLSLSHRSVAIMIANGKMYFGCDHQECYCDYCEDIGVDSGIDWGCSDEEYEQAQEEAEALTNFLFSKKNTDIYGFDIFESCEDYWYLTSHFPDNMEKCYEMVKKYAEENNCRLGTFFDPSYNVKLIQM